MDPAKAKKSGKKPSGVGELTLYRVFDTTKTPSISETNPGMHKMNETADAVLDLLKDRDEVLCAFVGSTGDAIINSFQVPVQIGENVDCVVTRVDCNEWQPKVIQVKLSSSSMGARQLVGFVDAARDQFVKKRNDQLRHSLYYFDQKIVKPDNARMQYFPSKHEDPAARRDAEISNAPKALTFSKFKMQSTKTFKNLCGSSVREIERRVRFFVENRKWYEDHGMPYQLGIMLSGESGSGKSSLVRAVANMTKRHVVNVHFADITTVTQLKKLFHSDKLQVLRDDDDATSTEKLQVPIEDRVYVLEELDAIGSTVVSRDATSKIVAKSNPEEITLADLLDVFDGNLEACGRIFIITTNRPEILDGALIRPGRVDLAVRFELATSDEVAEIYDTFNDGSSTFPTDRKAELPHQKLSMAEVCDVVTQHLGDADAVVHALAKTAMDKVEGDVRRGAAARTFLDEVELAKREERCGTSLFDIAHVHAPPNPDPYPNPNPYDPPIPAQHERTFMYTSVARPMMYVRDAPVTLSNRGPQLIDGAGAHAIPVTLSNLKPNFIDGAGRVMPSSYEVDLRPTNVSNSAALPRADSSGGALQPHGLPPA